MNYTPYMSNTFGDWWLAMIELLLIDVCECVTKSGGGVEGHL